MQNWRSLAILAGILTLLAVAAVIVPKQLPDQNERPLEPQQLYSHDPSAIDRIQVTRRSHTGLRLERTGIDTWDLVDRVRVRASTTIIRSLVEFVRALRVDDIVADPVDFKTYGLETPLATIQLFQADTVLHTISIGDETPYEKKSYIRLDQDPRVFLVKTNLIGKFMGEPASYRERNMLTVNRTLVNTFSVTNAGKTYQFERRGSDGWFMRRPVSQRVNRVKANGLLSKVLGQRAQAFVEDGVTSLDKFGLTQPLARAWVTTTKSENYDLRIGKQQPLHQADGKQLIGTLATVVGSGTVFLSSESLVRDLKVNVADYKPEMITDIDATDLRQFAIFSTGLKLEFKKNEHNEWKIVRDDKTIDVNRSAKDLLNKLRWTKIERTLVDPNYQSLGLSQPIAVLYVAEGNHGFDLRVARPAANGPAYVARSDETIAYETKSDWIDAIQKLYGDSLGKTTHAAAPPSATAHAELKDP